MWGCMFKEIIIDHVHTIIDFIGAFLDIDKVKFSWFGVMGHLIKLMIFNEKITLKIFIVELFGIFTFIYIGIDGLKEIEAIPKGAIGVICFMIGMVGLKQIFNLFKKVLTHVFKRFEDPKD